MKFYIILLVVAVLLLAGCSGIIPGVKENTTIPEVKENKTVQICTEDYAPVCGKDGKTYPNACFASLAKSEVAYLGPCKVEENKTVQPEENKTVEVNVTSEINVVPVENTSITACGPTQSPVCGKDGKTYQNSCAAGAAKTEISHTGGCVVETKDCLKDGNSNIYVKGSAAIDGQTYTDVCISRDTIKEFNCVNNALVSNVFQCPSSYSCNDGACTKNVQKCDDNNGTSNLFSTGITNVTLPSQFILSYPDECSSGNVKKYYCDGDNVKSKVIECPQGYTCDSGACKRFSYCYDYDGGQYQDVAAYVSVGDNIFNDTCVDGSTVTEYYCDGGNARHTDKSCAIGKVCRNGGCQ